MPIRVLLLRNKSRQILTRLIQNLTLHNNCDSTTSSHGTQQDVPGPVRLLPADSVPQHSQLWCVPARGTAPADGLQLQPRHRHQAGLRTRGLARASLSQGQVRGLTRQDLRVGIPGQLSCSTTASSDDGRSASRRTRRTTHCLHCGCDRSPESGLCGRESCGFSGIPTLTSHLSSETETESQHEFVQQFTLLFLF